MENKAVFGKSKSKRKNEYIDSPPNNYIRELLGEDAKKKTALAEKLVVSIEAIRNWTTGYARPEISKLPDIADFFGVDCEYLLRGASAENRTLSKDAGLTNTAIERLKEIKLTPITQETAHMALYFDFLNYLIESYQLVDIVSRIHDMILADGKIEQLSKLSGLVPARLRESFFVAVTDAFRGSVLRYLDEKADKGNKRKGGKK